jgi:hypothetical protein
MIMDLTVVVVISFGNRWIMTPNVVEINVDGKPMIQEFWHLARSVLVSLLLNLGDLQNSLEPRLERSLCSRLRSGVMNSIQNLVAILLISLKYVYIFDTEHFLKLILQHIQEDRGVEGLTNKKISKSGAQMTILSSFWILLMLM